MKKMHFGACVAASSLVLSTSASATLIAFYEFDSPGNLGLDSSSNNVQASNFGTSFDSNGFSGGAAQFHGNSRIRVPIDINPAVIPNFTWGAWVKPTQVQAVRAILSQDNGPFDRNLNIDTRGGGGTPTLSAFRGAAGGVVSSGLVPSTTDWTFIAATYDESLSQMTLFAGGNAPVTTSTSFTPGFSFFDIGANPGFGEGFVGSIDNVFVFDETLSVAEINQIQAQGSPILTPTAAVPEPSSNVALLGLGALGLMARKRRSSK